MRSSCTGWQPDNIAADDRKNQQSYNQQPFLLETSQPGIFAAGDVRFDSIKRVASAVGEGSMTVKFVHQVLSM